LLVTRRAIADVVRSATLGSYGVVGLAASPLDRLRGWVGLTAPGIRIVSRDGDIQVDLDLVVGYGLPIAEVARQVDAAVRHAVRGALERDVARLAIHVEHLRDESAAEPSKPAPDRPAGREPEPAPRDGGAAR
jgi:uncharacterized alkaline shock family protein YloU